MEQRIGNTHQNHPHFYHTETSLIPMSNNNGLNLFVYPFRRHSWPDRQNLFNFPIPDQTLEAAFSSLNLSPAPSLLSGSLDPDFGGSGLLYNAQQQQQQSSDNVSLRSLRFQNGQMGSGLGPRNPAVGPEGFVLNSPQPAPAALVRDSWRHGDGQRLASGPCDLDCLESKKQRPSCYLNARFVSSVPCSNQNTNNTSLDFGRLNNQFPQTVDFGRLNNPLPQLGNFLTLNDLKGRLVSLAKDQYWSRILQAKFLEPSQEEIEMVLSEVIDYIGDLMKNQFGNYLVQKLIAVCNEDQRTRIILSVTKTVSQLITICLNPHGTRGVQKLLENVNRPQQVSLLMAAISPGAATLANDQNGLHVIQYCLKHFSTEDNMHLLNDIAANCFEVAIDKSGCRVMQACLENSRGKAREHLVSEIIAYALHLAEHPYGNYVLQYMLGLKELDITADLLRQLEGNYLSISCNKYGSNVVEKCLIESGEEQSTKIIMELVRSPNASMILLDPFGNFVIQSALSVSKEEGLTRNALLHLILENASFMRINIYGKKVLAYLEKKKIQLV